SDEFLHLTSSGSTSELQAECFSANTYTSYSTAIRSGMNETLHGEVAGVGGAAGSTTEMGHAVQAVHAPVLPGDLLMAAQITRDSINQWMGPAGMLAAFFSFLRKDTTSVDKRGAWNPRGPCDWSHAITDARRVADSDLG
ncbi:hypothetical protein CYMTET_8011, partial [Cymbomonas tetramitiformis]